MEVQTLEQAYAVAAQTTEFSEHLSFTKLLLSSNEPEVIRYHFELLSRRENRNLYLRVRASFDKRGEAGEKFLLERREHEQDPALLVDIVLILGWMRSKAAPVVARSLIAHTEADCRRYACVVLGWTGEERDIALLEQSLLGDPEPLVRGMTATAMRQLWIRLPESKTRLLSALRESLTKEQDLEAQTLMVVSVQSIAEKRFGLREIINEGTITGDTAAAREKTLKYLNKLLGEKPRPVEKPARVRRVPKPG